MVYAYCQNKHVTYSKIKLSPFIPQPILRGKERQDTFDSAVYCHHARATTQCQCLQCNFLLPTFSHCSTIYVFQLLSSPLTHTHTAYTCTDECVHVCV